MCRFWGGQLIVPGCSTGVSDENDDDDDMGPLNCKTNGNIWNRSMVHWAQASSLGLIVTQFDIIQSVPSV